MDPLRAAMDVSKQLDECEAIVRRLVVVSCDATTMLDLVKNRSIRLSMGTSKNGLDADRALLKGERP